MTVYQVASAVDPTIQFSLPWRQIMCGAGMCVFLMVKKVVNIL
jgi:hypothetical protein